MSGGRPSLYRLYRWACFLEAAAAAASSSLSSPLSTLSTISSGHEQRSLAMSGRPSLHGLYRSACSAAAAASSSSSSPLPISLPTMSSVHEQRSLTMSGRQSLYRLSTSACSAAAAGASSSSSSPLPIFPSRPSTLPQELWWQIGARMSSNDHVRLNRFSDFDGIFMTPELMQLVADRGGQGNSLVLLFRMPSGSFHLRRRLLFSSDESNAEDEFQAVTIPYLPDEISRSVPRWPVQVGRCLLAGAARGCVALFIDLVSSQRRINNPTFITLFNTLESETGIRMLLGLEKRFHRCPVLLAFIERGELNPFLMIANEATDRDPSTVLVYDWAKKDFEAAEIRTPLHRISSMRGLTARAVNLRKKLYWLTAGGSQITTYEDNEDDKVGKGGKGGKAGKDGGKKIICQFGQHPLPPGRKTVDDVFVVDGELWSLTSTEEHREIWRWNGSWELHQTLSQKPPRAARFVASFSGSSWLIGVKRRGIFDCRLSEEDSFSFSHDALQVDETEDNLFLSPTE